MGIFSSYGGYSEGFNSVDILRWLGIFTALAATVLAFIFILPENKREKLPKIGKIVHDILNMKELYLEKVIRAVYVFLTLCCIIVGVLMMFGFREFYGEIEWYGGYGLLLAILGPVVLRLFFEATMMFILLVKNTISINNKLKNQNKDE